VGQGLTALGTHTLAGRGLPDADNGISGLTTDLSHATTATALAATALALAASTTLTASASLAATSLATTSTTLSGSTLSHGTCLHCIWNSLDAVCT